jgi:hypothetical protein
MIKFAGLGYNTKRIHSINIRGKYLRNALLEAFSEFSGPSVIAVVSLKLPVISSPYWHSLENSRSPSKESRQI